MGKVKIDFSFDGTVYETQAGEKLSDICEAAGYPQDLVCGGNGKCGKCAVEIVSEGRFETVFSCRYTVEHDITVKRIVNLANRKVDVLTTNTALDCNINPDLTFVNVKLHDIQPEHCASYMAKIKEKFKLVPTYHALKKFASLTNLDEADPLYTFICYKNDIIDVIAQDENVKVYGMAIDIGSTTVAGYVYDMGNYKSVGTYSSLNAQTALGADVISRIGYCITNRDENGIDVLRKKVTDTINSLLSDAEKDGIDTKRIYHVVLCGNSTMQHLFLGCYPESLGMAPFVSTTHDFVQLTGSESLLNVNPEAVITFLPLLGGFVGADTTGVLIGLPDDGKVRLALDLGTNGELACGTPDRYIIASTACGPALEGAGLSCGMRAADGALQHFVIDENNHITLDVIGKVAPTGICGSGIIDIFAQLIKSNVINARGQMMTKEKYIAKYGENEISRRLVKVMVDDNDINAFMIAFPEESGNGDAVYFSQLDAREIQKAKAAIATGCRILVRNYGIKPEELGEICLAGAFGNYLDVENAQTIGLFPKYDGVNVRSVGNGAGTGVQMFLLDKAAVKKCYKVQANCEHTELNFQDGFMDIYFDEMLFKNAPDYKGSKDE